MAWEGSTRRQRLPADWNTVIRPAAERRNPQHVCHWCGLPGGSELDHKERGDDHRLENLDWIHSRADYLAGRSPQNCHGIKSSREGAQAPRVSVRRAPERHPAL